ncbi:hypothetical protein QZN01_03555 [Burkholderia cenocepacia]|uniref:hypothetical protein n=1 Tax=Burkholderia cenocepacia TaxID=95486 RepID=UPI00264D2BE6|nr:hypothetical protein [Burkholderia cenocepacia]MDN7821714.1 hypothetical protein [Burkholderia cenocepacia]HEM9000723.1 hypothetical protein [Burkholderia cenocepacia]
MKLRRAGFFLGAVLLAQQTLAEPIKWDSLGKRDDYEISWASAAQVRKGDRVGTMVRMMFDHPDQAPNNARFDNKRITVNIDCSTHRHQVLQVFYSMGNRSVYSQFIGGDFVRNDGTFVEKLAMKVCPADASHPGEQGPSAWGHTAESRTP